MAAQKSKYREFIREQGEMERTKVQNEKERKMMVERTEVRKKLREELERKKL
jgi:hypothetical protein